MNGEEWQGWNSTVQYSTVQYRSDRAETMAKLTISSHHVCSHRALQNWNCTTVKSVLQTYQINTSLSDKKVHSMHNSVLHYCYLPSRYSVDTDITRAEPHYCHLSSGGVRLGHLETVIFYLISADISGKYQKVDSKGMRSYNPKFGSKCSFKDLILS